MPTLPSRESLGRRSQVSDRGGIATKRTGQVGAAIQGLANTVEQIEVKKQAKEDRLAYAHARSSLLQSDIDARKELEGDPDWATYEDRYNEKMKLARSEASGMIKSNSDRAMFDIESETDIARGSAAIGQKSWKGEVDSNRAALASVLDSNRNSGLEVDDFATRVALINSTDEALSGAQEKGYISAIEAVTMKKKWTDDFAESSVTMMEPDKRVEVLSKPKGTLAENIPADRRKALLEAAKKENKEIITRGKAQVQADKIVSKGGSLDEQLRSARDIEDPDVRDSVTTRIKNRYNEALTITNAVKSEALDKGYKVAFEGGSYDDIAPSVLTAMDPKDALNLKAYMNKGGVVKTDKKTWYGLTKMKTDNPREFAELDMLKFRNALNDGDWKAMVKDQSDMRETKEVSFQLRSNNQMVDDTLRSMGFDDLKNKKDAEKIQLFRYQYESIVGSFQKQEKRIATVEEKRKILDEMSIDVAVSKGEWWGTEPRPAFTITINDITDEEKSDIMAVLKANNEKITDDAIVDLFIRSNVGK